MQDIKNINTIHKPSFNSFLTNCEVLELNHNKEYDIVFIHDNEIMVKVVICDYKGWWITQSNGVDIWNDAQRELLFNKIDEVLNKDSVKEMDSEEPYYPTYNFF